MARRAPEAQWGGGPAALSVLSRGLVFKGPIPQTVISLGPLPLAKTIWKDFSVETSSFQQMGCGDQNKTWLPSILFST